MLEGSNAIKYRGRGSQINPKNRFENQYLEEIELDFEEEESLERKIKTRIFRDTSKTIISKNNSEDIGFSYSINPYRGCEHGCSYCYARPSHEYWGFSSGLDFESKIIIKENAAELLEKQFRKKSYEPDIIIISGNTDCYQPLERKLKITREILKVCLRFRNPVGIITKNSLIKRDIDIISEMAKLNLVTVALSVTSLKADLLRKLEPRTSSPEKRLETIKLMSENNVPVGVNVAPIIPGLNDKEIPAILKAAAANGAEHAVYVLLRLPYAVKDIFVNWLRTELPDSADKVINRIKETRNGKLYDSTSGKRFTGEGTYAETIKELFRVNRKRYKLTKAVSLNYTIFNRDGNNQLNLF